MKKIFIISMLITLVFSLSAFSYADECSPTKTSVWFGNGVGEGQDFDTTFNQTIILQNTFFSNTSVNEDDYKFDLAFNFSENMLVDAIEAARQTLGNEWPTLLVAFIIRDTRILSLLPGDLVQQFNDFLNNRAIQEMVAPATSNSDVSGHVTLYEAAINEGKKVIVVAHSQGNIFANLAFQRLNSSSAQYFTIVPVASPESYVRKSLAGHIRFSDDLAIAGVAAAKQLVGLPVPLSANDEDNVGTDFLSHSFVDAYLADTSAKQYIVQAIITSENALPAPPTLGSQGTITVTLDWGSNPDVDLHIYEPTGRHVYYGSRYGQFGYLDQDVTWGYGPEHYYVSCQTLRDNPSAIGRYRFGVNYYSGSTPEVATVTVQVPGAKDFVSKTLPSARYSSGNNSPVPMADVIVTKNPETGRFSFAIERK